jgi:hypothetical protein
MSAPIFSLNEIVYLAESASLGELEAYRIGAIKQASADVWLYQIFIDQKPPAEQTVGDRIDLKEPEELLFEESELIGLCSAVNTAIKNVEQRINKTQNLIAECETTGLPPVVIGAPTFAIGDTVFIKASASIGFIETYKVVSIHRVQDSQEFTYELDLTSARFNNGLRQTMQLFFKERELVDKCTALNLSLAALDRKISRLLTIKFNLCTSEASAV